MALQRAQPGRVTLLTFDYVQTRSIVNVGIVTVITICFTHYTLVSLKIFLNIIKCTWKHTVVEHCFTLVRISLEIDTSVTGPFKEFKWRWFCINAIYGFWRLDPRSDVRTRQIIRYRATATLPRPQNKQYSASKWGGGVTKPTGSSYNFEIQNKYKIPGEVLELQTGFKCFREMKQMLNSKSITYQSRYEHQWLWSNYRHGWTT